MKDQEQRYGTTALKAINFLKPIVEEVMAGGEEKAKENALALTKRLEGMSHEELDDIGRSFDALFEIAALAQMMLAVQFLKKERRGKGISDNLLQALTSEAGPEVPLT